VRWKTHPTVANIEKGEDMAYINESDIEEAHIELFETLGYTHLNGWKDKPLQRQSLKEIVLKDRLQTALTKLNPQLPITAIDEVIYELTKSRTILNELEANQEVYELIKNGVPVTFTNKKGKEEATRVKVVEFDDATQNEFLVVSQLTIENRENNHHRRPDLLLYVNGLPLVMVELKRPNVQGGIRTGFDKNLQDYKKDIPQLFYYNLFVMISDGIETRIGSFNALGNTFLSGNGWMKREKLNYH